MHLFRYPLLIACLLMIGGPYASANTTKYPPTATLHEVAERIALANAAHPRLFANAASFARIRQRVDTDPQMAAVARSVLDDAHSLRDIPPIERVLQGRRLLGQSRTALWRITTLAMAWHIEADADHVRRAEKEMVAIAEFKDWNPSHYLDVAEMTMAMAIGYDWLHGELSPEARTTIRDAIIRHAVRLPFETNHKGWVRAHNNWGQVCHAGMVAGALAVMEDEPELAAKTVHSAIHNVTVSMAVLKPKGGYNEGPGYWNYGMTFNVLLIEALESVLGTEFGLASAPGFAETGAYPHLVTGPSNRTFNYADGGDKREVWPASLMLAARYGRDDWAALEIRQLQELLSARAKKSTSTQSISRHWPFLLFALPDAKATDPDLRLPLAWHSECKTPIAVFRSSWTNPNATFFGLKGGSPSAPHGHMDAGSFVLDADGVRWAFDFGMEGYHGIESRGMNLWSMHQDAQRWTIFRINHLSHNIPLINLQPQIVAGSGIIDRFQPLSDAPFAQVDLSSVYKGHASSVRRGMRLLPGGLVLITDELRGLVPGTSVRWAMLTEGIPDALGADNVTLRKGVHSLRLLQPGGGTAWSTSATDPPPHEWDSPNPGSRLLVLTRPAAEDGAITFRVLAIPGSFSGSIPDVENLLTPLQDWK